MRLKNNNGNEFLTLLKKYRKNNFLSGLFQIFQRNLLSRVIVKHYCGGELFGFLNLRSSGGIFQKQSKREKARFNKSES